MVLEQELARVHYKVGKLMMDSLKPAKYQEAACPRLQGQLSRILTVTGQTYISQYNSQITNGAKRHTGKCTAAKSVLEEALSIQRALSQDGMSADTLTTLAIAHSNLEMFDEARSTLMEALDLTRRCCYGEESARVA